MRDSAASFQQSRTFNAVAFRYYPALDRVEHYVQAHVREHVTLDVAARVAGLEKKYFSAFFHAKVGITFRDWTAILRVRRAIDIMRVRRHGIPQLAFASGFKDVRSFERTFKKLTGLTPRAFRAAMEAGSKTPTLPRWDS